MDNNSTISLDELQMLFQEVQDTNTQIYAFLASLTVTVYAAALALSDEIELMWNKLGVPSILYFSTRYCAILFFATTVVEIFLPSSTSISTCNAFTNLSNALGTVSYCGLQGLLVVRAYSLSQSSRGKWFIAITLASLYLSGLVLSIYEAVAFSGCLISDEGFIIVKRINLGISCLNIATDSVVFAVTLYQIWGTWTLQRELKQDTKNSIVSLLFKQGVWRYCFVLSFTLIDAVLSSGVIRYALYSTSTSIQQSLSTIFLCEFSLQLRRQSRPRTEEISSVQTMTWSLRNTRNVLRRVHDTTIAELGEFEMASVESLEMDTFDVHKSAVPEEIQPDTDTNIAADFEVAVQNSFSHTEV